MTAIVGVRSLKRVPRTGETVPGLVARDGSWFAQLYEANVQSVYRYAAMLVHDGALAEDVTAEVFMKAWRGRDGFRGTGAPLSWLLSITHNSAINVLRHEHDTVDVDSIHEPEDPESDPADQLGSELDAAEVRAAIARLTPDQQQVILLRFFEGLPHEAVAARLGRNPNAIRAVQFRALSRLRKLLGDANVAIA
jgi:RNA polymerase sigma-70 factor (ECF subfamily)